MQIRSGKLFVKPIRAFRFRISKTQAAEVGERVNQETIFARLSTLFALLALAITCVGLYGAVSYNVAQRTNEIGIHMALGAQRASVIRMILRDVLTTVLIGLAAGVPWRALDIEARFIIPLWCRAQ